MGPVIFDHLAYSLDAHDPIVKYLLTKTLLRQQQNFSMTPGEW